MYGLEDFRAVSGGVSAVLREPCVEVFGGDERGESEVVDTAGIGDYRGLAVCRQLRRLSLQHKLPEEPGGRLLRLQEQTLVCLVD